MGKTHLNIIRHLLKLIFIASCDVLACFGNTSQDVNPTVYFPNDYKSDSIDNELSCFSVLDTVYNFNHNSATVCHDLKILDDIPNVLNYLSKNQFLNNQCDSLIIISACVPLSEYPWTTVKKQYCAFNGFSYTYFIEEGRHNFILPKGVFPLEGDICDALEDHPLEISASQVLFSNLSLLKYICFKWQIPYICKLIKYSRFDKYSHTTYSIVRLNFDNNKIKSIQLIPNLKEAREWRIWE